MCSSASARYTTDQTFSTAESPSAPASPASASQQGGKSDGRATQHAQVLSELRTWIMHDTYAKLRQCTQTDLDDWCGVRGLASMQQVADFATNPAQQRFHLKRCAICNHQVVIARLKAEPRGQSLQSLASPAQGTQASYTQTFSGTYQGNLSKVSHQLTQAFQWFQCQCQCLSPAHSRQFRCLQCIAPASLLPGAACRVGAAHGLRSLAIRASRAGLTACHIARLW